MTPIISLVLGAYLGGTRRVGWLLAVPIFLVFGAVIGEAYWYGSAGGGADLPTLHVSFVQSQIATALFFGVVGYGAARLARAYFNRRRRSTAVDRDPAAAG